MKTYETPDLYMAAYLVANDYELASTRQEGARLFFAFEKDEDFEDILRSWGTSRGTVVAHKYAHAVKDLKALTMRGR